MGHAGDGDAGGGDAGGDAAGMSVPVHSPLGSLVTPVIASAEIVDNVSGLVKSLYCRRRERAQSIHDGESTANNHHNYTCDKPGFQLSRAFLVQFVDNLIILDLHLGQIDKREQTITRGLRIAPLVRARSLARVVAIVQRLLQ